MISAIHTKTWEALEESLTPLHKDSKEWRIFHYLPAASYFPAGLLTLALDSVEKILSYAASFFYTDKRDPNKDFTAVLDDSCKWKQISQNKVSFDTGLLHNSLEKLCTFQVKS